MSKYSLNITSQFKRDLKVIKKRNLDLSLLDEVIENLLNGETLDPKYYDHSLTGNYKGFRECHVKSDWL